MLIKDLKFIEQVDDFDLVQGGKVVTDASVTYLKDGVSSKAKAKAKGKKPYAKTYTKGTAYPKAKSGAASAVASSIDGKNKKIYASIAHDIGAYLHDLM